MKWWLLAVIPIAALISHYNKSGEKKQESSGTEISVTVLNSAGIDYVYLKELNVGNVKVLDSIDIRKESRAIFSPDNKETSFYLIHSGQKQPIVLLVEPGEKVKLVMQAKDNNSTYEVSGSPGSLLLKDFQKQMQKVQTRIDSLKKVFESVRNTDKYAELRPRLDMTYKTIFEDEQAMARRFIDQHPQSLASLFVINQRLGPQRLLTIEQDFSLFSRLDSALMQKYPNNKHAIDHHSRVSDAKRKIAEQQLAKENPKLKKQE
ncbi:MAG: DUF4369 domain-containing protein [Bacteroidota bacterium]